MAKKKMSQDRAFLDDIGANPDDDGPRLIYADWLDDQGQAHRAEFIRLQCRLARMSDWDADRLALERRERDLLRVYGDQWAWVLPTWARDTHRRHPFRRGFPDVVSTTASKFLQSGASLLDAVPIGGVRLRAVNDHWRELADSPLLGRISSLSFFGAQIEEEELSTLLRSPNSCGLRSLSLEYTGVGLAEMRVLAKWEGLPRLRWLDLSGNRGVDGHALSELATGSFDSLEWLRLGNIPGVAEAPALAACAPRLTHLDLSRTDAGADWFARLATAAPTLGSLALTVPSDGVGTVLDSPLISQLESLTVNGYVSAETLQRLVRPASPARLRRLAIRFSPRAEGVTGAFAGGVSLPLTSLQSGGKLGPADIEGLASSPQLAGLRRLHLGGNPIGDAGVRALLTSPHLRALEILDLSLCEIGLASAGALAESPNLSRLRELRLHITDIGTAGVEALAGSANLRNLHGLSLGLGEGLSLKAVRALARSPHLRELRWLHVGRTGKAEEQMEKELSNPERLPRLLELNENRPQWLRERPHNL